MNNSGRTIRLPMHLKEKILKSRKCRTELQTRLGRPPTDAELADRLGVTESRVGELREWERVGAHTRSLFSST